MSRRRVAPSCTHGAKAWVHGRQQAKQRQATPVTCACRPCRPSRLQPEESAASREALLDAVSEHFAAQQVDENEVIACFLSAVKRHRMGLPR